MVSSLSAAEHALPVDLIIAVFLAICLPCANIFEQAALAKQVLWLGLILLSVVHFLLAIDKSTEVGLLALVTLVEGASMIGKLLRLLEVNVVFVGKTFIFEDTLISGIDQSLSLHDFFESKQGAKLLRNRF